MLTSSYFIKCSKLITITNQNESDDGKSCNQIMNDLSPKLAQLFIPAPMKISEFIIVQAQEVKKGNMKVSNGVGDFHRT